MTTNDTIKNIDGKVAVVMGATRNQGRAYAVMLARNGCRGVAVHYHGEASRAKRKRPPRRSSITVPRRFCSAPT